MTIADALRRLGCSAPDPRSDGELLHGLASARDEGAFTELLRRFGPTVYGVCRRVLGNGPDADDAFQAVFLVPARKASALRGRRERAAPGRRSHRYQGPNHEREATCPLSGRPHLSTSFVFAPRPLRSRTRAVIDAELAAWPVRYRAALVADDLNSRTRREAARELGWPKGTVTT